MSLRLRQRARDLVRADAGLQQVDRAVHPFARLAIRGALRRRRAADVERAVVARAIAHERLDDVEERLVAGTDQAVGEVVRMRAAALAGDRVDRLDAVGAHLVEARGRERDDLAFLDAGLQRLGDVLVDAVDHRRRHVEQRQLVDVLHFARLQQRLLAVAHLDAELLQLEAASAARRRRGRAACRPRLRRRGCDLISRAASRNSVMSPPTAPRKPEQSGAAVIVVQPRRVQSMMLRRRAEVPDVRIAVAGEQRIARQLVARPFADHRARRVADVVLVEAQQRAEPGCGERGARAREPVVVQAAEVDALLEVDLRVARRLQRPVPAVMRIDVVRAGRSSGSRRRWLSSPCVPLSRQRSPNALS